MILFAIVLEPFLRQIMSIIGNEDRLGAFADDIGIVLKDVSQVIGPISDAFKQFGRISGLDLNINKCVCTARRVPWLHARP